MQRNRLALALAILTLVIYTVLSLVCRDFVRDNIVIPIAFLVWIAVQIIRSIHQGILLAGLIVFGFASVIVILLGIWEIAPSRDRPVPLRLGRSRYRFWLACCHNMYNSHYSLDMMSSELRQFLLSVLACQEHRDASEVEKLIAQGSLDVPPAVYDLIVARRLAGTDSSAEQHSIASRLRGYLRRRPALGDSPARDAIDRRLAEVIAYIEEQLEGTQ